MVSKSGLDLQRRDRSGPPRNLAPSDFFHVTAKPRHYRNSVTYLAAHGKCSRSRRLNRPKSSLVSVLKLVESLESFVFQRRRSDSLGRAAAVWTQKNRPRYDRDHLRYPSDLTDEEWAVVAPLIPPPRPGGGKRRTDMRAVVNGLMYILSTGCQWRYLPKDFPPHSTVYNFFVWWQCDRVLDRIHHALYVECRERAERQASPTAAIIDSQSVKSAEKGGPASIRMASMPVS